VTHRHFANVGLFRHERHRTARRQNAAWGRFSAIQWGTPVRRVGLPVRCTQTGGARVSGHRPEVLDTHQPYCRAVQSD